MTSVLVDSNVLLDIVTQDPRWMNWSIRALETAADRGPLIINPMIFAEVSVRFSRIEDVDDVLPRTAFQREEIPYEAAFLAGKCFVLYRRRGGARRSPLPDFFIGAHAAVANYRVLTRDTARYKAYFPALSLIAPD